MYNLYSITTNQEGHVRCSEDYGDQVGLNWAAKIFQHGPGYQAIFGPSFEMRRAGRR
jgi:hypothetical protein